ncbi:hypothetical protein [Kitasatospora sp. NPDC088134]|uniref:hypothetical protein n=1 Tax=Kitasatospora sp. NPDC088134 TaxID=3364071 RepID=UPI00382F483F
MGNGSSGWRGAPWRGLVVAWLMAALAGTYSGSSAYLLLLGPLPALPLGFLLGRWRSGVALGLAAGAGVGAIPLAVAVTGDLHEAGVIDALLTLSGLAAMGAVLYTLPLLIGGGAGLWCADGASTGRSRTGRGGA